MPTLDSTPHEYEVWGLIDSVERNPNLYAPDGKPWCTFKRGLFCVNGNSCKNPNHRKYGPDDLDQV
jgi:hypothetical protein